MQAQYTPREVKPDALMYAVEALEVCESFDRTAFEKRFAEQPPPFDATRPPKLWFDTTPAAGNYLRVSRDATGKPSIIPYTMTKELASSVNIPGAYRWPRRTVEATPAEVVLTDSDGNVTRVPVAAATLSREIEAAALASEIGGVYALDNSWWATSVDWKGETRRMFNIILAGQSANAGYLLAAKAVNGIGAPGRWEGLSWTPDPIITTPLDPKVQSVPVPCRALAGDEEFRQVGPTGVWQIAKKSFVHSPTDEAVRLLRILLDRMGISY